MRSCAWLAPVLVWASAAPAVDSNEVDTFDDGTLENWTVGVSDPMANANAPTFGADCGDEGAGDGCMILRSSGQDGLGGKLSVFNETQWVGDYVGSVIVGLRLKANNLGDQDVVLRLRLENADAGDGAQSFITVGSLSVPAGVGYVEGVIPLTPQTLNSVATALIAENLSGVTKLRLFHNPAVSFRGPLEMHEVHLDDLQAVTADPIFATGFESPSELNDTGVIECADDSSTGLVCPVAGYPGQDAEFGRDVTAPDDGDGRAGFSFTKFTGRGERVLADATAWACVLDHTTGLHWESKRDNDTFRDRDRTFAWFDNDEATNGGEPGGATYGGCPDAVCNIQDYVAELNDIGLCGFRDWRVPTVQELAGLVDHSVDSDAAGNAMIDQTFFPLTPAAAHWTSQTVSTSTNGAWVIDFSSPSRLSAIAKSDAITGAPTAYVLAVRGRPLD